jgi:hypothetical protein
MSDLSTVEILDIAGRRVAEMPVGEGLRALPFVGPGNNATGDHKGLPYYRLKTPIIGLRRKNFLTL